MQPDGGLPSARKKFGFSSGQLHGIQQKDVEERVQGATYTNRIDSLTSKTKEKKELDLILVVSYHPKSKEHS